MLAFILIFVTIWAIGFARELTEAGYCRRPRYMAGEDDEPYDETRLIIFKTIGVFIVIGAIYLIWGN